MRRFILTAILALTAACSPDNVTSVNLDVYGKWNLTSVNHASLPVVLQESNPRVELLSETLFISESGIFRRDQRLRVTNGDGPGEVLWNEGGRSDAYDAGAMLHFRDGTNSFAEARGGRLYLDVNLGRAQFTGTSTTLARVPLTTPYQYERQ